MLLICFDDLEKHHYDSDFKMDESFYFQNFLRLIALTIK